MNYTKKYIKSLIRFTQKELNFDELKNLFYNHYMDNCLELEMENFFSDICEKMDFTADDGNPTDEEREYGWINIDEFRIWLVKYMNANHHKISF